MIFKISWAADSSRPGTVWFLSEVVPSCQIKGLTPQDPLYFFYGQTHRVTKFFGTFRPTEHDSEKKLVKNWGNPPGKWI